MQERGKGGKEDMVRRKQGVGENLINNILWPEVKQ